MVDRGTVQLFADAFGGKINQTQYSKRRLLYYFHSSDTALERLLAKVGKYLRLKKPQMELILQLRRIQNLPKRTRLQRAGTYRICRNQYGAAYPVENLRLSDEYLAKCEELYRACQALSYGPHSQVP